METLDVLEQNVQTLLKKYAELQEENQALRAEVERQRTEMVRVCGDLQAEKDECRRLRAANGMLGSTDSRNDAYKRLSQVIAQVDKAIETLKQ